MNFLKIFTLSLISILIFFFFGFSVLAQTTQGVPIPTPSFTQAGADTCQQASFAMVIAALGLFTGTMSPSEVYEALTSAYGGTSSSRCFKSFVVFLIRNGQNANVVVSGSMGAPRNNVTYANSTIGNGSVRVERTSTSTAGPHPTGPVPPGKLRILGLTWTGSWTGHNVVEQARDLNNCFPIPGLTTTRGRRVMNPTICPTTFWDPNTGTLVQSFITSDGAYVLLNGRWEHVSGTATVSP
jgi:hypothetical protein